MSGHITSSGILCLEWTLTLSGHIIHCTHNPPFKVYCHPIHSTIYIHTLLHIVHVHHPPSFSPPELRLHYHFTLHIHVIFLLMTFLTCFSHGHHMLIRCFSHAHHMLLTCSSHAHHMLLTCSSHVPHLLLFSKSSD